MLYFIRHGETDDNRKNVWMGRKDLPLSQAGIDQAKAAAEQLAKLPIAIIMTSPLLRARQTADLIAQQHPRSPAVRIADWLTERDFGPYEGMKKTSANRIAMNASTSVESMESLTKRLAALKNVSNTQEHLLIVSHSGVYRCLVDSLGYQSTSNQCSLKNAEFVSLTLHCGKY
ncbi:histidine phosphatase family protein [Marinobacter sp. 1-3A]|uniref:histidine phosphatase family protein n=1 Tax=Marinobacter sp. 1-3A TaxID=2582920 RepID=UPI00190785CC|nr:histidine phosphatase family protein [Marinobacter sp. 1-3A]MBK1872196.1 histidine phosphatase family protein [Marinobacter sp. 1-3A]